MQADIFDALNVNTKATGNFKKPPKFPLWPRPGVKAKSNGAERVTVADLYNKLSRR